MADWRGLNRVNWDDRVPQPNHTAVLTDPAARYHDLGVGYTSRIDTNRKMCN